jgi:hypothetical protein
MGTIRTIGLAVLASFAVLTAASEPAAAQLNWGGPGPY